MFIVNMACIICRTVYNNYRSMLKCLFSSVLNLKCCVVKFVLFTLPNGKNQMLLYWPFMLYFVFSQSGLELSDWLIRETRGPSNVEQPRQVIYLIPGPSFHDFWGRNKVPFPSQKSIYFSPTFKKNSPTRKEKQTSRIECFLPKMGHF